jgi:hypothetical protein
MPQIWLTIALTQQNQQDLVADWIISQRYDIVANVPAGINQGRSWTDAATSSGRATPLDCPHRDQDPAGDVCDGLLAARQRLPWDRVWRCVIEEDHRWPFS